MKLNELIIKLIELQGIYGGELPVNIRQKNYEAYGISGKIIAYKTDDSNPRPARPECIMIEM